MLIPQEWDLDVYPGFQFNPLFEFFEDEARTQPFNLTGFSAQMTIGNGLATPSLTLGGALGTIQALLTGAQTANLPLGQVEWSLAWTPSGGQPDCPAFGRLLVAPPVPSH